MFPNGPGSKIVFTGALERIGKYCARANDVSRPAEVAGQGVQARENKFRNVKWNRHPLAAKIMGSMAWPMPEPIGSVDFRRNP